MSDTDREDDPDLLLAMDRLLWGVSFEMQLPDGTRHRIDPGDMIFDQETRAYWKRGCE
jgi:hypothetical protein